MITAAMAFQQALPTTPDVPFKGLVQFSLGSVLKSASKTFNELHVIGTWAAAPLSIKPTNVDDKGVYTARAGETFTEAKMMINNLQGTPMENTDLVSIEIKAVEARYVIIILSDRKLYTIRKPLIRRFSLSLLPF